MARLDYKRCRRCGQPSIEVGELSHTRLCRVCGPLAEAEAIISLAEHDGPIFQRWRRGMAACVGNPFLDDALANAQTGDDAR